MPPLPPLDLIASGDAPIPVIYVIGSGRSGSTLLGQLLGGHSDVFYTGEVYNFRNNHQHTIDGNPRWCSCGETVMECPLWIRVRARLEAEGLDPLVDLKDQDPATFEAHNGGLFRAIVAESGRRVLVDASKRHYRLDLLLNSDAFDVSIVHLVRDARAKGQSVIDSLEKRGRPPRDYYTKMWSWQTKNLAMRALYGRRSKYEMVRYEDLAANPSEVMERVLAMVGLSPEANQLDRAQHEHHDFSGNIRARLRNVQPVKLQTRYLDTLNTTRWALGTALVAPGLKAFGYPLGREATRRHLAEVDGRA